MTKFNKSLLTAAVVGALALPSLASAAELAYPAGKQITFAKDLIVNNDTTIYVPRDLVFTAEAPADTNNIATVTDTAKEVRFKVTLTNGAKFDSTADAETLVKGFIVGTQLGGDGASLVGTAAGGLLVGTPYYSASGQELNFTIAVPLAPGTTGVIGAGGANDYSLKLNSMQITNLVTGLFDGSSIGAEITAQNQAGQQILASKATIARSVWGLTYADRAQNVLFANAKIDVVSGGTGSSAFNRKTRFSPTGLVGGAGVAGAANTVWSPGGVTIDVATAAKTGAAAAGAGDYINNYSAIAAAPMYNVVTTSEINVKVKGTNLSAFANLTTPAGTQRNTWLSTNTDCSTQDVVGAAVVIAGDTITYSIDGNSALVTNTIGKASAAGPSPLNLSVCLRANSTREMVAQSLSGEVSVDYDLPTQRVNPPAGTFTLKPLRQNGTEVVFQNVNPAGNATAQSFLRLTNNNAFACPVVIDAKDDAGKHSGDINLSLAAHQSKQLNSEVLEGNATSAGVTGKFGDGTGKWYVRVLAECDNFVASALNRHQDGVVTDLTPQKGDTWLTPDQKL